MWRGAMAVFHAWLLMVVCHVAWRLTQDDMLSPDLP
jgi:hypothetical protein